MTTTITTTAERIKLDEVFEQLGVPGFGANRTNEDVASRFDIELPADDDVELIIDRCISDLTFETGDEGDYTPAIRNALLGSVVDALLALLAVHDGNMGDVCEAVKRLLEENDTKQNVSRFGESTGKAVTVFLVALDEATKALRRTCHQVTAGTLEEIVGDGAGALEGDLTFLDYRNGNRYFKPLSESYVWDLYQERYSDE